ncbi:MULTISPECIES: hypothetical protein [unclassified Streptomyces]|uniref:hypothetical protein n=1 Tax=unclassified Streptomyces TaxID=2593676 RepID=UPI0006AE1E2D|nr:MULTISPECIES: hypothetical protein [unclassified Streptomyces]KOX17685.1 membrane protein [Streptomyces sp. NRRL F-6491]KOX36512.1 membrane protein [Streptomyces sp. NRRL F-6492]
MPTPRHHLNRQRRRQALAAAPEDTTPRPRASVGLLTGPVPGAGRRTTARPVRETAGAPEREAAESGAGGAGPRRLVPLVVLCVLTLLLGGFAGWAHGRAGELRDEPARSNTALTDLARTSEIKGQTTAAVAALFSYDHADTSPFERAGKTLLTGKAVEQHRTLLGGVLARAAAQKTVITTTVTDSAVERIDGERARVLVYADQSSVSTAGTAEGGSKRPKTRDQGVYAGAMFAVDVVHRDGRWLVENIDTFGR